MSHRSTPRELDRSRRRGARIAAPLLAAVSAALLLPADAAPAGAASLHVYASGLVHDYPLWAPDSDFEVADSDAGPIQADAAAGYVIYMYHPDLGMNIEGTLYAEASARADFGTNGVYAASNLRAPSGDDRGAFPATELLGGTLRVETTAESIWRDTFVITGGEGVGVASVDVRVSGLVEPRYGANGDAWYAAGLEGYGRGGGGTANYRLAIDYGRLPPGLDPEYSHPIRWEENYFPPLDEFAGSPEALPPGLLTGTFVFEYGVPFELTSSLSVSGYSQVTLDFDHTATLSQFALPVGAALASESGHLYPVAVPEPAAAALLATGLLGLGAARRVSRRRAAGSAPRSRGRRRSRRGCARRGGARSRARSRGRGRCLPRRASS